MLIFLFLKKTTSVKKSRENKNSDTDVYHSLEVEIRPFMLRLEERLLLKLIQIVRETIQSFKSARGLVLHQDAKTDLIKSLVDPLDFDYGTPEHKRRCTYFEKIQLNRLEISISLITSSNIEPELETLKQDLGFSALFKFEDALICLQEFTLERPFTSFDMLMSLVMKHFKQEFLKQTYKIVGSVDFLGNPIGVLQNVQKGFSAFAETSQTGNIFGGGWRLAQHMTVALADSASKLTGSISSGIGRASMDRDYQIARERILSTAKDSTDHLSSGVLSFTSGFYAGITGVFTQPFQGMCNRGVEGFIQGAVRGVVGAVTKPVAGMFDLVSETSAAVRQSAAPARQDLQRLRLPRAVGPDQSLHLYSADDASGRDLLLRLNRGDTTELYVARIKLGNDCLNLLVSSERVLMLEGASHGVVLPEVRSEVWFSGLYDFKVVTMESTRHASIYYLQFIISKEMGEYIEDRLELNASIATRIIPPSWSPGCEKVPFVARCDSEYIATAALLHIQFALNFYAQRSHLVHLMPSVEPKEVS